MYLSYHFAKDIKYNYSKIKEKRIYDQLSINNRVGLYYHILQSINLYYFENIMIVGLSVDKKKQFYSIYLLFNKS